MDGTALFTTLAMIRRVPRETFIEGFLEMSCEMTWKDFVALIGPDISEDDKLYPAALLHLGVPLKYVLWGILCFPKEQLPCAKATWVHFACDCAERVLPLYEREYSGDFRVRRAIEASRNFAAGRAAQDTLRAARDAAVNAVDEATEAVCAAWAAAQLASLARRAVRKERPIPARTARGAIWTAWMAARAAAAPETGGVTRAEQYSLKRAAAEAEYGWQRSRLYRVL